MNTGKDLNISSKDLPEVMTEENKNLFPKSFQEAFDFFNGKEGEQYLSKKYYTSQRNMLKRNVKALFETSPELPPKKVLLQIMETLPDFLPAENLLEVTKIITTTWEELQQKVAA